MKKRLLFLLTLLAIILPVNVFADFITYEYGTVDASNDGVAYIPIRVEEGNDKHISGALTCHTSNGLTCTVEIASGYHKNDEGGIEKDDNGALTGQIAKLVIKNSSQTSITDTITVKEDGQPGVAGLDPISVTVKGVKPKSSNAKLTGLSVSSGTLTPSFSADNFEYTVYGIPDTIRHPKISYKCENCTVKMSGAYNQDPVSTVDGYTGTWQLDVGAGEKSITIDVTSEDGTKECKYVILLIVGDTGYGSAKLKSLTIGEYKFDPEFTSDTLEYKVSIPKKLSNISKLIQYEAEDKKATVEVKGADTLDNDENEVTITVTGQTGDKTIYKLTVVKEDEVQAVIDVIGYKDDKVTFIDTEGNSQTLSKEEFKTQYPDEWTKIENGEYKFDEDGNIIRDKSNTNSETNSNEKKKSSFPWLIVVLIILAIAVIAVSGYFIFRDPTKKKNKKGKGTEEEDKQEPTEEEKEHLEDIDSYNEEARLIAEDNIRNENTLLNKDTEDNTTVEEEPEEDKIDETGIEEEIVKTETIDDYADEEKSATMDIDEALSDLMNTKEYNFKDK